MAEISNPFDITKAVDLPDELINSYWTNFYADGGFEQMLQPTSLTPMIIRGSKGSGKTHIMRYFSYELQKLRYATHLAEGLSQDKFLGVYIACSGFNAEKYSGKGVDDNRWSILFSYFWELWVGERMVFYLEDLKRENIISQEDEEITVRRILDKFDRGADYSITSFRQLDDFLLDKQKDINYEINNFLYDGKPYPQCNILFTAPTLTYGIPNILRDHVAFFKDKIVLYLIDELENFSVLQQQLIQTIIREKPRACTIRIGARLYGVKTYCILGGAEENRPGSEFEPIVLDQFLREHNSSVYYDFIRRVCNNRLKVVLGFDSDGGDSIEKYIEDQSTEGLLAILTEKRNTQSKSYFNQLRSNLQLAKFEKSQIDVIIKNISYGNDLLIERSNVVFFYRLWKEQRWNGKKLKDLVEASEIVRNESDRYSKEPTKDSEHGRILDKFKMDFVDILAREGRETIPYYGFDKLVKMSCGTPRTILNVLKHAFKNEYFEKQHAPFVDHHTISLKSQKFGIDETIEWFYEENRIPSVNGKNYVDALMRLGTYLRKLRFSCLPPESSINCFSIIPERLSESARKTFDELESHSYLINVNSRRDKNTGELRKGYQINLAILPKWDLPISIRGVLELDKNLAEMIFNLENSQEDYERETNAKVREYNAPFAEMKIDPLPLRFED